MPESPDRGPYFYTPTVSIPVTDAVQTLQDEDYIDYLTRVPSGGGGQFACYAALQVLDFGVSVAEDADPVQDGLGFLIPAGSFIYLFGRDNISKFRFLNATNGSNARLIAQFGF